MLKRPLQLPICFKTEERTETEKALGVLDIPIGKIEEQDIELIPVTFYHICNINPCLVHGVWMSSIETNNDRFSCPIPYDDLTEYIEFNDQWIGPTSKVAATGLKIKQLLSTAVYK